MAAFSKPGDSGAVRAEGLTKGDPGQEPADLGEEDLEEKRDKNVKLFRFDDEAAWSRSC